MNSANADKSVFAEKDLLNATYLPISNSANGAPPLRLQDDRPRRAMMSRIKHILFVLFALALLASALVGASTSGGSRALSPEAQQFRDLLDTLDATTLHEILHEHFKDKYQHGVYQEDKSALEALHKQNAAVARSLVRLAKRQVPDGTNGSSVVTTTAVTETTIEVTITSTSTPSLPPVVEPTPTPSSSETPVLPEPTPSTTSTVPNPPASTTTSAPPSTTPVETSSSAAPSTSVPSTLSSSTTSARPTTSSGTSTSPLNNSSSSSSSKPASNFPSNSTTTSTSPSSTLTSTSSASSGSTRTPSAEGDVTTSIVYTTTLANGAAIVTTQYTVVPADQVAQPTGTKGSGTNTANASLQTGLASSQYQRGGWTMGMGFLSLVVVCAL